MENKFSMYHEIIYAGFWKRVKAGIIDLLIMMVPILLIIYLKKFMHMPNTKNILDSVLVLIITFPYYIFFQVKYGGTPGKLISGIRIINQNGRFMSIKQAFLRNSINYLLAVLNIILNFITYRGNVSSQLTLLKHLVNLAMLSDVLVIVFNEKKRAVHDLLANSYVVTNESRLEMIEDN